MHLTPFNRFPNKPWFLRVCSACLQYMSFENNVGKGENLPIAKSRFPNKPWFLRICSTCLQYMSFENNFGKGENLPIAKSFDRGQPAQLDTFRKFLFA